MSSKLDVVQFVLLNSIDVFYTTGKRHILCAIQSRYTQVRRRTSQNDLVLPMGTLASAGTSLSIFCTLYYLEISQ